MYQVFKEDTSTVMLSRRMICWRRWDAACSDVLPVDYHDHVLISFDGGHSGRRGLQYQVLVRSLEYMVKKEVLFRRICDKEEAWALA